MHGVLRHTDDACPAARALSVIGDSWSLLIVRELFRRPTGFADLRRALEVSDHTLSRRLARLVEEDIVEHAGDTARTPYRLTEAGQALGDVLVALGLWGRTWRPVERDAPLPEQLQALLPEVRSRVG